MSERFDAQATAALKGSDQMAPLGNNINPSPHEDRGVISGPGYGLWNSTSCAEPYVDAKEGAAFLRIHPKTLMRLARQSGVPAYSFSEGTRRHWRFLISELDKWMKSKVHSSAHPVTSASPGRRK